MVKNLHHTKNYLFGSIGIKALGFISVPFFTNYLSVEEFGMMSLYVAILSFLSTLLSLGVLGSFKRYYFKSSASC
jgi:O-antigen/teichoic acid export membrane protein